MTEKQTLDIRAALQQGLLAGLISLSLGAIGMVELFSKRDLIAGVLSLGQVFLFIAPVLLLYSLAKKYPREPKSLPLLTGLIGGGVAALPLILLVILASNFNLRQFLPNVSPALVELLTFKLGAVTGSLVFLAANALIGLVTTGMLLLPDRYRRLLFNGILYTLVVGMFSEVLLERLRAFFGIGFTRIIFDGKALNVVTAIVVFILIIVLTLFWDAKGQGIKISLNNRTNQGSQKNRRFTWIVGFVFLMILPFLLGSYLSEVTNNVLIYVLMGFGLNIVVGFAGLLDLGYVAFFAFGAYTMALLTSTSDLGIAGLSFWLAIPICILVAVLAGVTLGIPVLRMRGDYLAIVTLGFGEIIRILAQSDLLKPLIGGAQGMLQINKPSFFGFDLIQPNHFYYVVLAGVLLAAFVSWRLSESRLGRQWMAMREDEDVAEAMGINLISTKLLAFGIGAAFSGLSGAIFASKLTSIFPHSFNLLVSINVLCLIIVGGMGSLPGVVVGSLILVGLPELLREFAEYRLLMYGALLVVMMLAKPEGFWPSAVRKRELHLDEENLAPATD